MALGINLSKFGLTSSASAREAADGVDASRKTLSPEEKLLDRYKQQALDSAKSAADVRGEKPTLTDYHIAAEKLWQENSKLMRSQGIEDFGPRVYSDLSRMKINGYDINNEHIEVPGSKYDQKSVRYNAVQGARALAHQQGRAPTRLDVLQTMKALQTGGDAAANVMQGIESAKDFLDLDENHEIGPLYGTFDEIASQTKFENTVLGDCLIHPAGTTFAHHAEGAVHNGCTFSGLEEGHEVKFAGTLGGDNKITGVNGGSIMFDGVRSANPANDAAKITMEGGNKFARIAIANSQMELNTGGASIVRLDVKKSTLTNSNFEGSTIDMLSSTDGAKFVKPNFKNTNLREVVFSNTTFQGADFSKASIEGMKFEGKTKLVNCTFSPEQIPQLRKAGIENVAMENVRVGNVPITNTQTSLDMAEKMAKEVVSGIKNWNNTQPVKAAAIEAPASQEPVIDRPVITAAIKAESPKKAEDTRAMGPGDTVLLKTEPLKSASLDGSTALADLASVVAKMSRAVNNYEPSVPTAPQQLAATRDKGREGLSRAELVAFYAPRPTGTA